MGLERGSGNKINLDDNKKHYISRVISGFLFLSVIGDAYNVIASIFTLNFIVAIKCAGSGFVYLLILLAKMNYEHAPLFWRLFKVKILRKHMPKLKKKIMQQELLTKHMSEEFKAKVNDKIAYEEAQLAEKEIAATVTKEEIKPVFLDKSNEIDYFIRQLKFTVKEKELELKKEKMEFNLYIARATGELAKKNHTASIAKGNRIEIGERDLCTNLFVTGATGTGKTTAVLRPALKQILAHPFPRIGLIVFDVKGDFIDEDLTFLAKDVGRKFTVIGLDPGNKGMNLCKGLEPFMVSTFMKSIYLLTGGKSGESFWIDSATLLCENVFNILKFVKGKYTLSSFYEYVTKDEKRIEYEGIAKAEMMKRVNKAASPEEKDFIAKEQIRLQNALDYYNDVFLKDDPKTQKGVISSLTLIFQKFMDPLIFERFCSDTEDAANLEDIINKGDVFGVKINTNLWGLAGTAIMTFIKLRYFNLVLQRPSRKTDKIGLPALNQTRLVGMIFDEYQRGVSCSSEGISDFSFWDVSRSARSFGILTSQSISSIRAAVGDDGRANVLLQNWRGGKITLRSEDEKTISYYSELCGKALVERVSESIGDSESNSSNSMGVNVGGNSSQSVSKQEQTVVDAQLFKSLDGNKALGFFNINGKAWDDVILLEPIYFNN